MNQRRFPVFYFILILALVLAGTLGAYWQFYRPSSNRERGALLKVLEITNPHVEFASEVYDKIKENYWDKMADDKLSELFRLAAVKVLEKEQTLLTKDREGVRQLIEQVIKDAPENKKKEYVTTMAELVLVNLPPFGRSRLYTTKQEEALRNMVENVDPHADLYAVLGITKNSSPEEIKENYQKKNTELKKNSSPEAAQKLAQVNRAYEALSAPEKKERYDQSGIEPTVISKLLRPDIFYIKLTKFSPTSFEELQTAANFINLHPVKSGKTGVASQQFNGASKKNGPTTLIFDLRGNIGGAIDILPYFLGPFIGPDQYAYEFFHQGKKTPFKTAGGWLESLVRYKKVVILIDAKSQSSAEVMAATLKKYNVGVLVGTKTKGWGTVEQVLPITQPIDASEKYSMLIAHSLTLREDGQPIENRGVEPMVNIEDKNWPSQLLEYFNYPELVRAVKEVLSS